MKAGLVVTGVLGTGSVLVFALAGLVATLFPNGTLVNASWNGGCMGMTDCGGLGGKPVPPIVAPAPGVVFQGTGGATDDGTTVFPVGTDGDIAPQP
jgi:hypothetical protein